MSTGIKMNYAALQTAAGNVNTAKCDLESVIAHLTQAVSALEGEWAGASYEAFKSAWEASRPTMERLAEAVGRFAPELNNAVATQQEQEAYTATKMTNLEF